MKYIFVIFPLIISGFFTVALYAQSTHLSFVDSLDKQLSAKNNPQLRILTLADIGREHIFIDIFKAFECAKRALELSDSLGYRLGRGHALRTLGSALGESRNYTQGVKMLLEALEIFKRENDEIGVANCYLSLGLLYERGKSFEDAINYEFRAIDLYRKNENLERQGVALNNISRTYCELGKYDSARFYINQAIDINRNLNHAVLCSSLRNLALINYHQDRASEAKLYALRVIDLSDSLHFKVNTQAVTECHLLLGRLKAIEEEYDDALYHINESIAMAKKLGYLDLLRKSYNALFRVLSAKGNHQQSLHTMDEYIAITDSILMLEQMNRLEMVQWYYQNSLQRSRMNLMEREQSLSHEIITRQKNSITLLVVAMVLAALLILGAIRYSHQQKKLTQKLKVANSTKNKLFSIIAHDFRSPIHTVLGAATFLKNNADELCKDDLKTLFRDMHKSILNTLRFTENILTWARSQMDVLKLQPETIKVRDSVDNVLMLVRDFARDKNIDIQLAMRDNLEVYADRNQFETIIRNLINNSLKFSENGDTVTVSAREMGDEVEVVVADTGVGMDEQTQLGLFRLDTKNSTKGTAGELGTGLGLIICKEFVENNNGRIRVESELDKGSEFIFTVPKGR